jgi:glycosyltransferase involved in cell wall biosynthesis
MNQSPNVSIVINNYNYGRFLGQAIQSALDQTYEQTEVVVVDDGSTDDSRAIIESYGRKIIPVLKENGGQGSAFNAGFAACHGDAIIFLDSDDMLLPSAANEAAKLFGRGDVVKVHWPLWEIDNCGIRTGRVNPVSELPEGNLRDMVLKEGPASHANPPTSGNAWARKFLEQVLPMPEALYQTWGDAYLLELAPLFGPLMKTESPQGFYRVHGSNAYATISFDDRVRHGVAVYDDICDAISKHCKRQGIDVDADDLKRTSWFHRVQRSAEEIASVIPPAQTFILADEDEWGIDESFRGRRCIPFLERDGCYWGRPEDDETAIAELERLRARGANYIVFAWPAFWWLDHYRKLSMHLSTSCFPVVKNERVAIYNLASDSDRQ